VTEVHWRIVANLGFKFRSHFTADCGRCAVLLAVLFAGGSSRAMLASARSLVIFLSWLFTHAVVEVIANSCRAMAMVSCRSFLSTSLVIILTSFVAVSHAGCGHKMSQAYLVGATNAEYPGIPSEWSHILDRPNSVTIYIYIVTELYIELYIVT